MPAAGEKFIYISASNNKYIYILMSKNAIYCISKMPKYNIFDLD